MVHPSEGPPGIALAAMMEELISEHRRRDPESWQCEEWEEEAEDDEVELLRCGSTSSTSDFSEPPEGAEVAHGAPAWRPGPPIGSSPDRGHSEVPAETSATGSGEANREAADRLRRAQLQLGEALAAGEEPDPESFCTMVQLCAEAGEQAHAELWLAKMMETKYFPDDDCLQALVGLFVRNNDVDAARRWIVRMVANGCPPKPGTYAMLGRGLGTCARSPSRLWEFGIEGCKPSQADCCRLIHESLGVGDTAGATLWLQALRISDIEPDTATLEMLIMAHAQKRDSCLVEALFDHMLSLKMRPSEDRCEEMLRACIVDPEEKLVGVVMLKWFASLMVTRGIRLGQGTCNLVLEATLDARLFEVALQFLEQICDALASQALGWAETALSTWERVVLACMAAGELELAGRFMDGMAGRQTKGRLAELCYEAMVNVCAYGSRFDVAEKWLAKKVAAGFTNNVASFEHLKSFWMRQSDGDSVLKLWQSVLKDKDEAPADGMQAGRTANRAKAKAAARGRPSDRHPCTCLNLQSRLIRNSLEGLHTILVGLAGNGTQSTICCDDAIQWLSQNPDTSADDLCSEIKQVSRAGPTCRGQLHTWLERLVHGDHVPDSETWNAALDCLLSGSADAELARSWVAAMRRAGCKPGAETYGIIHSRIPGGGAGDEGALRRHQ